MGYSTDREAPRPLAEFPSFIEVHLIKGGVGYSLRVRNIQSLPGKGVEISQRGSVGQSVSFYVGFSFLIMTGARCVD